MHFSAKCIIFYYICNIFCCSKSQFQHPAALYAQIYLCNFPTDESQNDRKEHPKATRREYVVRVTHTHGHLYLNLIRHAIVHIYIAHLIKVFEFKKRIGNKNRVAFFAYIMRYVHAIGARYGVAFNAIPIFHDCHHLWRATRIRKRANYK